MNTRAKGNRVRRKAIEQLQSDGYEVAIVERTGRFIKEKDAFGIGDLLAINERHDIRPLLIQVTCNKPHTHKPYIEFNKKYWNTICAIQMVWKDNEGFTMYIYGNEGKMKKIKYR